MHHCSAPGCSRRASGYSPLCRTHFSHKRRHGDVGQQRVTRARLQPHLNLVRTFIARNGDDALWAKLETLLTATVREAGGIVAEARSGRPFHRPTAFAAAELVRVAETVPARAIVETVAAVAIMLEREPRGFKSDDAARVQTSRLFRALSPATKRTYVGRDAKVRTITRDLRMDVATALGRMLLEALGPIGFRIAETAARQHQQRAEAYQAAYTALQPATI